MLLVVVLGYGSKEVHLLTRDLDAQKARKQVLCSYGDYSWHRQIRRLLHLYFLDPFGPCIGRLTLGQEIDKELPEDVLECWITCFWALCATRVAADSRGVPAKVGPNEDALAAALHKGLALANSEALSDKVIGMFSSMDLRYGDRLGVAAGTAWEEHVRLVNKRASAGQA